MCTDINALRAAIDASVIESASLRAAVEARVPRLTSSNADIVAVVARSSVGSKREMPRLDDEKTKAMLHDAAQSVREKDAQLDELINFNRRVYVSDFGI